MVKKRIGLFGFQHETNTFAPTQATFADFEKSDNWPKLLKGDEILSVMQTQNIPMAGFIQEAQKEPYELVPLVWANAVPSGHVTEDAFLRIFNLLREYLDTENLDALYCDLHGAMVTTHSFDGEGELLERLRQLLGDDVVLVASLDFHANVTDKMFEYADFLYAYKTYPHVDMAETGKGCARFLNERFKLGSPPQKARQNLNFLIPMTAQCTLTEPNLSIYRDIHARESNETWISYTNGFPLADIPEAAPSIFVYSYQESADDIVSDIKKEVISKSEAYQQTLYSANEVFKAVKQYLPGPVVIADTEDNPGCGGNSDTTWLLEEAFNHPYKTLIVTIADESAADTISEVTEGDSIHLSLGATSGLAAHRPVTGTFTVVAKRNTTCKGVGPYYLNCDLDLGKSALLQSGNVWVIVASNKVQAADRAMIQHFGVNPEEYDVIVVKSSVHFRADFNSIATTILIASCDGPNTADLNALNYKENQLKSI